MDDAWTHEWHKRLSGWYVWTWSKPRRQEGAKGPFESFPAEWHWNVILAVFPIHTAEYAITVALFLTGTFTTKVGTGRVKSFDKRMPSEGSTTLVHHSWWDYILGMENSCLACMSHMSILQAEKWSEKGGGGVDDHIKCFFGLVTQWDWGFIVLDR